MILETCAENFRLASELSYAAPQHAYLLMDGARFENIYAFLYEQEEQPEYFPLYRNTYYESAMEVSPCLVRLSHSGTKLVPWFDTEGAQALKAMAVVSDMSLKQLGEHFQQFLEAKLPTMEVALFRFYDPVIFDAIAPLKDNALLIKMMQPCSAVYWKNNNMLKSLRNNA